VRAPLVRAPSPDARRTFEAIDIAVLIGPETECQHAMAEIAVALAEIPSERLRNGRLVATPER
jgi:hypothetical protein